MCPQIACLNGCKITLVAFARLFPAVSFQMSLQRTWMRACKVTLVAIVWLFSTVHFHMCPQMACMRRCIITQVAIVWFFPLYIGNSFTDVLLHGMIRLKNLFNLHKLASCVTKIKIYLSDLGITLHSCSGIYLKLLPTLYPNRTIRSWFFLEMQKWKCSRVAISPQKIRAGVAHLFWGNARKKTSLFAGVLPLGRWPTTMSTTMTMTVTVCGINPNGQNPKFLFISHSSFWW